MEPRIEILGEKKLVGKHLKMSFSNNRTGELWRDFMPRRKEICSVPTNQLFSLQVYDGFQFDTIDPSKEFEKWALVEVSDFNNVPEGMETFSLLGGLYAVFTYKGLSSDISVFRYIFATWLPASCYVLDNRPHFEILGEKYKNGDPNSEEEIWIPIMPKP
jgi:AraC family transcriptional regulator